MKKKTLISLLLIFTFLLELSQPMTINSEENHTKLSKKPLLYSRVVSITKSKDITTKTIKNADKLHKNIVKCKNKTYVKEYKTSKQGYAELTYMFGKYLSYIRQWDLEYYFNFYSNPKDKHMKDMSCFKYNKKKKRYIFKINVTKYKKWRKKNHYIREQVKNVINNEINFPENCTEEEAIKLIAQWLCKQVDYDTNENTGYEDIYNAFKHNRVICMGYADAFQVIANEVGIKCWIIGNDTHQFNKVVYDGQIRYVDVCWADGPNDVLNEDYIHLTEEERENLWHHSIRDIEELKIIKIKNRNFKEN